MRRHTFLIMIMTIAYLQNANAQTNGNLMVGYGIGTYLKTDGLSFIIGRYNETRNYLSKEMEEPHFFSGLDLATELYLRNCLVDLEFIGRKSDVFAEASGTSERRDLRYRTNTYNFGAGIKINSDKDNVIGFYPGIDFSSISAKTYTRVYVMSEDPPDYEKITWDFIIGFSPFVQFVGSRFTAKAYYQFMLNEQDYWYVNQALNPNTWSSDVFEDNFGKSTSIGIVLRFNLWENDKDDYDY